MRNRRGLSTVVGAVFFVIAATTVIRYISYSMNTIDQFAESVIVKEAENINRGLEDITISQVTIDDGEFNMTVVNTGSLPIHLTRLWVTDENSAVPDKKADIDVRINPGKEAIKIGEETGIVADSTISYSLKIVTERGNLATYSVSPDIPMQIQLLTPASVTPGETIRVTALITNNSTKPNNVANLIPIMKNNATLTEINGPLPPNIQTLPKGNTAVFTWKYQAPDTETGILFNASYTGAPEGSFTFSNVTVAKIEETEASGTSDWASAARRVGILISGIPNPVNGGGTDFANFGIGIINPLDRPVDIYAVAISSQASVVFITPTDELDNVEPIDGWSSHKGWALGSVITWQGGDTPITVPAKEVAQFRVQTASGGFAIEGIIYVEALSSEGKFGTTYAISSRSNYPSMNIYYTNATIAQNPRLDQNWGYLVRDIPSGKIAQQFNVTVDNSSGFDLESIVKLIILVPADFTNVIPGGGVGWNSGGKVTNEDGSTMITTTTTDNPFDQGDFFTYTFTADAPTVTDVQLYVFQTTTIYPDWDEQNYYAQIASALSEAGVEVVP